MSSASINHLCLDSYRLVAALPPILDGKELLVFCQLVSQPAPGLLSALGLATPRLHGPERRSKGRRATSRVMPNI